ncbi:hypothetical protein LSCM4_06504 [Leishmania orientalis]|uniref:Uncharacterized protein n=1 Tax=Leishmania orientalis TaxID=2249476 RepID=A0A836HGN5_9TRYP|nr:hypothetical protein LSCM4_06504 [Leishmania orientalis]
MEASKARGGHLASDAASEGFTYTEYWRALMATAERVGQSLHAENSRDPVPAAESPTPAPPPSRRAETSHLTAAGVYRLHLALTPSPHKAERIPLPQPQQQEPPHLTRMSRHIKEGSALIEGVMRAGKEGCAPAGHSICTPSSARKSLACAVRTGSWVSLPSTLDSADSLSDKDADTEKATGSKHTQRGRATVIGGTRMAGSIFEDERGSPAPSDDKDLVDSPRQRYSVAGNFPAQYAFPLTAAAAPLDSAYTYTPDDLIVKAAQCYEQWRQCLMEGNADTDADDYAMRERHSNDGGSSTAEDDQVRAGVRGTSLPDTPQRESAGTPCAAAPNEASSGLPPTAADDTSGLPNSFRKKSRPDPSPSYSLACTRGKQTPSCTGGVHSRLHSLETTAHGLTSGRRERVGDTGSTTKAPVESPSLSTRVRTSPRSQIPSPHVASSVPTALCGVCRLEKEAAEPATVEIELETSVEEQGARSRGTSPPPQQRPHQHSLTEACHCLCRQAEMHAGVAASLDRSGPTHRKCMSEDVRIVDEASGSLQSVTLAEVDVGGAHNAGPLSLVYRRLFIDDSEDGYSGVADTRHRESGGMANSTRALAGPAPCFRKEGLGPLPSDALDLPSESQHGVTRAAISGAADNLTPLSEADHPPETLIELSSSCSSDGDNSIPVEGANLMEGEIAPHFEADVDQQARASSPRAPYLDGNRRSLILASASHLSLQSPACSIVNASCDGRAGAELSEGGVHTTPAATTTPLSCSDHPLWHKHHALVSTQYASQLLPSEKANDELLLFLCWAQEKAERQNRWRQKHPNGDDSGSSTSVLAAGAVRASWHVPCGASEVYKAAYAAVRRCKWAGAPASRVHHGNVGDNSPRDATVGASSAGISSAQATPPSCQRSLPLPHPAVYVASPQVSCEAAMSSPSSEGVEWTLTPAAAPARFVEWISTEVDPYESLLFAPL